MDNLVLICVCIFVMPLLSVDCIENRKEPMKNQTRMVGKTVKLKCIVSGYPRPEFTWYKDGKLIEAGVKTIKRGSRLVLRSLQVTATGQYECVARNSQGVVSTGALLIVKKVSGRVDNLRVLYRGAHHFLVEWDKPKEPNGVLTGFEIGYQEIQSMDIGNYQMVEVFNDSERSRAFIGGLTQSRKYRIHVKAKTNAGTGETDYMDVKTTSPGPLLLPKLRVAEIGDDFVNITWTVEKNDDNPAGSIYFVKYRKKGDFNWQESDKERIYNWVNVSDLARATYYEMIVVASDGKEEQASEKEEILTTGGLDEDEPYINFWLNRGNDGNKQVKTNPSHEETASQETVTVVAGQPVVLPCSVQNIGNKYKVVWTDSQSMILSLEDRMITDDRRFSIERPSMSDWNLKIIEVDQPDQGNYTCQINTEPVKSKVVTLHVEEPIYITNASTPTTSQTPSTEDEDKPYFNFWLNRGNDGNKQVKTNHSHEETVSQETVTVVAGQPAVLPCSVQNLGNKYKVVWTDPQSMILSLEDRMIIDDRRFSIERPSMSDWNLKIIEVDRPDQGNYTCQINTEPVKSSVVTLHVEEPIYTTNASRPTTTQTPSTKGMCVNNSIPMCKDLGYSSVYMPYNQSKTIEEVGLELHQFWPIVEVQCSGAFKPFLCYMYTPPCSKPRMPCRRLCEEARMGCEPLMNNYGFRWPDSLGCTRLPAKDCLSSDSTDNIYSHNENNNTHFYDLLRQPSYTTRASRASTAQMSTKTTEIPPTKVGSVSSGGGAIFIEANSSVYIRDNAYRGFKYQPVTTDLYVNPRNFDMIRIEDLQTERRDCPLEMTECYVMKFRRYGGSNRQQSYTEIALAFSHIDEFNKARGVSNRPPKL